MLKETKEVVSLHKELGPDSPEPHAFVIIVHFLQAAWLSNFKLPSLFLSRSFCAPIPLHKLLLY